LNILVINPGGNYLKEEIVSCEKTQRYAFEGKSLLSVNLEGIGKEPRISRYEGKKVVQSEAINPQITAMRYRAYSTGVRRIREHLRAALESWIVLASGSSTGEQSLMLRP
jgi:hypothetical protein